MKPHPEEAERARTRKVYFGGTGFCDAAIVPFAGLVAEKKQNGPAIIESPFSSVVADPGSVFWKTGDGSLGSEEHTSELQSLMRISYAVFCLKNKKQKQR